MFTSICGSRKSWIRLTDRSLFWFIFLWASIVVSSLYRTWSPCIASASASGWQVSGRGGLKTVGCSGDSLSASKILRLRSHTLSIHARHYCSIMGSQYNQIPNKLGFLKAQFTQITNKHYTETISWGLLIIQRNSDILNLLNIIFQWAEQMISHPPQQY